MNQAEQPPSSPPAEYNSSSSSSSDEEERDIAKRTDLPSHLQPHATRLLALRQRLQKSSTDNRREVYQEHQRKHEHPGDERRQARKRRAAELLLLHDEAASTSADYERTRFKDYSIERVEKYQAKVAEREGNREQGFTDYAQVNARKYSRDIAKLKPDLSAYRKSRDSQQEQDNVPDPKNVDRLAKAVEEQQKKRAALLKPSIDKEGEDVSYINERNARFNRMMNRAYDKHTKEIKDNFERGTAL
ncbi:pre-mRNA-splicing factor SYF2 [Coemansia aciculifera]|uniref:Pre-mRNA-splicing factor SYF2 n=1 Tax=Coemansia aciculifera TaxID=417176 RepID=A0ACC1M8W4_9FUNG|nr:pre-mRNA-splicing factor SYF2 [Coemansia aciculifera]